MSLWGEFLAPVKPVCSRTYSVLKSQNIMIKKEIKHLESTLVLGHDNDSEWGAPSFAYKEMIQYNLLHIFEI